MSVWKLWSLIGAMGLSLFLVACTGDVGSEPTGPINAGSTTSTTTSASGSADPVKTLDLSSSRWVSHGPDGMRLDDGTLLWVTQPFPAGVVRDGAGGVVFSDSTGLWWFPAAAAEPTLVREGALDLVSVVDTDAGPLAMIWQGGPVFLRLSDGETVDAPPKVTVEVMSDGRWVRTAANGLSVWATEAVVEWDAEGQPSAVLEPGHLIVARADDVLVDVRAGEVDESWVRIHDFDGRMLILSRGPYEPAMAEETFLVIDLATGEVTESFIAAGTRATFTGDDVDWDGPVVAPDLAGYAD